MRTVLHKLQDCDTVLSYSEHELNNIKVESQIDK